MGHGHPHPHPDSSSEGDLGPASDLSIPDLELSPAQLSRRGLMRGVGLFGASAAAASVLSEGSPAEAHCDGIYRVVDQARHAQAFGLDWMVVTDHGSNAHAKIGVEKVNPDIRAARDALRDLLIFQGLEWNIPAAEHGTVFVHPGRNEVAVLKEFENGFDGSVTGAGAPTPANEALAAAGIQFLGAAVRDRRVEGALFLANHPARRGIDSPHEFRLWRDADPTVAVGMEGAPGHQAAGIAAPGGPGSGRGFYSGSPSPASFPGYPLESYRTWGGFDFFTSTVGGLWDKRLRARRPLQRPGVRRRHANHSG